MHSSEVRQAVTDYVKANDLVSKTNRRQVAAFYCPSDDGNGHNVM